MEAAQARRALHSRRAWPLSTLTNLAPLPSTPAAMPPSPLHLLSLPDDVLVRCLAELSFQER